MDKILADKAKTRKELADLPFDEKLTIMEKIRERSALLAENPLRKQSSPTTAVVIVAGGSVVLSGLDARKTVTTPPAFHQLQHQSNILQNSGTGVAIARSQAGRYKLAPMVQTEFESESQ